MITDWHAYIKRESREQRLASVVRMRTVSYDYVGCQYLNFKFKTIETIFWLIETKLRLTVVKLFGLSKTFKLVSSIVY